MKKTFLLVLAVFCATTVAWSQAKASLTIMCNVGGAQVFLAGQLVGNTTVPNMVLTVRQGTYPIKIIKNGFRSFDSAVVVGSAGALVQANLVAVGGAAPDTLSAPNTIATPQNYSLNIGSNVNGAVVFINGNQAGQTPFTAQVPPGSYTVIVRAPGFQDFNQNVVVNGPSQVNAMLQGQNQALTVQSNVAGAVVFINGNQAGQTPFTAQVPSGSYAVLVRAPGYLDFNQNVIVGNGPTQVSAMLQAQSFQLSVSANVNGALVFVNGSQVGQTPYVAAVPPGTYTVLVRAAGFNDYQVQVPVTGPQALNVVLQPMLASWQLRLPENMRVRDKPGQARGFEIWIDGIQQPSAPGQVSASGQLPPGRHVIRLVSGGMASETQVDIDAGRSYTFEPYIGINVK